MRRLVGDGVALEPQVASHAAELYALLADPALYVFTDDKEPLSEEWLRERFTRLERRLSPDGTQHWLNWVVRLATGEAIGYVQATVYPDGEAELAYVLGRPFWRRGYATAACRPVLAELAVAYGVHRLTATLDPANAASLALLARLGFRLDSENPAAQEVTWAVELAP